MHAKGHFDLPTMRYVLLIIALILGPFLHGQAGYPWPASYWPLDRIEDNRLEDVAGGRDAVLPVLEQRRDAVSGQILPTFQPEVVPGLYAEALSLKKAEQGFATIEGADGLSWDQGFSISVWIRPDRRGGTMVILGSLRDGSAGDSGFQLRYAYGTGSFHAMDRRGERVVVHTAREAVRPNRWSHFAVVGDEATLKFYHNGALVDEKPFDGPLRVARGMPLVIGNHAGIASYRHRDCPSFSGLIQDLKIWEVPLSAGELHAAADESLHP